MEKFSKEYQFIQEEQNMLVNLKIINLTDMEILFGQMVINILENGKMEKIMGTERKYGMMEENIQEHLTMINYTAKELFIILMAKNMSGSL